MTDDPTFEQLVANASVTIHLPATGEKRFLDTAEYQFTTDDETEVVRLFLTRSRASIEADFELTAALKRGVRFTNHFYGVDGQGEISGPIGGTPEYRAAPAVVHKAIDDRRPEWRSAIEQETLRSRSFWQRLRDRFTSDPSDFNTLVR